MTIAHFVGAVLVLLLIAVVGVWSGSKVRRAADFSSGGRSAGVVLTACSLTGTMVGGASTIGTAQLAFTYGFSAWWYTLGGGIALIVMGLFVAKPFYRSGHTTIGQVLAQSYGKEAATAAAMLMSLGTFLSIVSQMLSGTALITSISPVEPLWAALLAVVLMMAYVMFGGMWGAGMAGIAKMALLYLTVLVCGTLALTRGGGLAAFQAALPRQQYFNLFARGLLRDGGAGLSLLFGTLSTQSYMLSVVSAKNEKTACRGTLLGGLLTLIVGVPGVFVGLYMRMAAPDCNPATVLPRFILEYLPPLPAGVMLGALLVTLVGSGAGLALGISSMLAQDIYRNRFRPQATDQELLKVSRGIIAAILIAAALFSFGTMGSLILNWSFLSMGLRGAVAFAPLMFALFAPGRVSRKAAMTAIWAGPAATLAGKFLLPSEIDPLFAGIGAALILTVWSSLRKK